MDIIRSVTKDYKRAVSTDRDSEVEVEGRMEGWNGNEDILEKVQDGTEKRKGNRMRTRDPTPVGTSSELEACAHIFWNVLE